MNCEDVPMSEWDKLTGAEEEALIPVLSVDEFTRRFIKPAISKMYLDALVDPRN